MADERHVEGEIAARKHSQDVARIIVAHLRASDHAQAEVWADALDWFRKRIKGGHLSILVQQGFDERFGAVDWSAFADSSLPEKG